jgi:hypothetical protein
VGLGGTSLIVRRKMGRRKIDRKCYFCMFSAVKSFLKLEMGYAVELDRHVITPPSFSAIFGLDVNFTQIFPEGRIFIDL